MDDMTFFHQATMKICDSLDENRMIRECDLFLKQFLPLSSMMRHLMLDGKLLGVVLLFSNSSDEFNAEHTRLATLLHDPFAMPLANVLKHRELVIFYSPGIDLKEKKNKGVPAGSCRYALQARQLGRP